MSSLTAILDPQVIDLKVRIVADFFVNPFLECTRDALALRQSRPIAQVDVAVADLVQCGVLLERGDQVVFEPLVISTKTSANSLRSIAVKMPMRDRS